MFPITISITLVGVAAEILASTIVGLMLGGLITLLFFFGEDRAWKFTMPIGLIISWIALGIYEKWIVFV